MVFDPLLFLLGKGYFGLVVTLESSFQINLLTKASWKLTRIKLPLPESF